MSRANRRTKGTGGRRWDKKRKRHTGYVVVGRAPSGAPVRRYASGRTRVELERELSKILPPTSATTLAEWLALWLEEMKCKAGTRRSRVAAVTHHLGPALGHVRVAELTPRQIEVAAGGWALEPTSARNVVAILGTALRAAVRAGLRADNPVHAAHKPRGQPKRIDPFTRAEVRAVAAEAARRPNTRVAALLAATGMRVGEALALDVPDVDAGRVSITKTLDTSDRDLRDTPKSHNSRRTIRIPEEPPEALAAVRAAVGGRTAGPVFRTATGRRTVYKVLYAAWAALLRRLGIRYRGPHQLRHSFATSALAAGVPVADVAAYLGNTPAEVFRTYAHATRTTDPAEAMERFFRSEQSGNSATTNGRTRTKP